MPDVVLDVQAVQSRAHGERGIARFTRDLALGVDRVAPGLVDAFVMNPLLPVSVGLTAFNDTGRLMRTDDPRLAGGARVYHVASPFESLPLDQLLPAPVVNRRTRVITTAYDLIPLIFPDVYLRDPEQAAYFQMRTALLRASNRVVCISDATAADVITHAGVAPRRVDAIYGGASDIFVRPTDPDAPAAVLQGSLPDVPAGFVLVPSGIEWRKNLDRLFEAYGRLDRATRTSHPLVVQCQVSDEQRDELTARLRDLGIAGDVHFTGFVADDVLVALYQAAHLVVFPSVYEGLGLPILEARRCGAPVICGDNSSLRELVTLPAARFDAEVVDDIADHLLAGLTDDAFRADLADAEPPDHFTWDAAAERFAGIIEEELHRQRRRRERTKRIAVVSPLPPDRCGPAMYLNEMLPALAEACDLSLFVATDPALVEIDVDVPVDRLSMLETTERLGDPFDEVIYFLGNSDFHLFYPEFLRRRPGAVVLHDARFAGLYGEVARLLPGMAPEGIGGLLHDMYPKRYPPELGGAGTSIHPDEVARFGISMVADIARRATAIYAHSHHAADLVAFDCGIRPTVLFPLPVRAFDHSGEGDPTLVGSFGIVAPIKAPDLLIDALVHDATLRLVFVGHVGDAYRDVLVARAAALGCGDRVEFTGEVSDEEYSGWLRRVGVTAQLRRTSNGESSAAVNDAIGTGTPVVVTDLGSSVELPEEIAARVGVDATPEELAGVLHRLAHEPATRSAMIAAQTAYRAVSGYPDAARALVADVLKRRHPVA